MAVPICFVAAYAFRSIAVVGDLANRDRARFSIALDFNQKVFKSDSSRYSHCPATPLHSVESKTSVVPTYEFDELVKAAPLVDAGTFLRLLRRNAQERVRVAPDDLLEDRRRRRALQQAQRLPRHAFAAHSRRCRIVVASAVAVAAAAVAAEEQLVLMPLQEIGGELRIARQRGVGGDG